MADETAKTVPQDASRVNIHEESEVEYWCKKFGVTPVHEQCCRRSPALLEEAEGMEHPDVDPAMSTSTSIGWSN
ncbi:MAG: DUF3606 domain-containing protein [Acidobacteriia bacterium]|nr:DUF3606 domain-containing protein [Terriglobia bacterium]